MKLETERLILRQWQDDDLDPFTRINRDPLIMEYFPRPLDKKATEKLVKRFQAHFKKYGYGFYAIELKESGDFIGFVGLGNVEIDVPFKPAVEFAWRLDYSHWGKGYATEAALAVANHAFTTLELKELVAYTVFDNVRSIHVMEKLGMKLDKKGDFHYPGFSKDSPLAKHVLFRMKAQDFQKAEKAA
ncbi:GNAT family N-acetyltransferase [Alphaproteobacteria bacterium]|nr:GNAT family N-acetyltransferase [Alphaproteobacteria bacterium]